MAERFKDSVEVEDGASKAVRVRLDAKHGNAWLGGNGRDGDLVCFASGGDNKTLAQATIHLDGGSGNLYLGSNGVDGDLVLKAGGGQRRVHFDGHHGNAWFGGNGADGDVVCFGAGGDNRTLAQATIHLDGGSGNLYLGSNGVDGDLALKSRGGDNRVRLDADSGNIYLGGNGVDGDLLIYPAKGDNASFGGASIHLNGDSGDIILRNADCAEDFAVSSTEDAEPGTVMVINAKGQLEPCSAAFDRCVAGVVAGAGDLRPGIILGREAEETDRAAIALMGRVWCKAVGPIRRGDLLTTSSVHGHAMRAGDGEGSRGAILGKALTPLDDEAGMVTVLVTLQ